MRSLRGLCPSSERQISNRAIPDATTSGGAGSEPLRRSVILPPSTLCEVVSREVGGRRSSARAAAIAAPASSIPHPSSGFQPPDRRAVRLISPMTSAALRSGLRWRTIAATAVTCGAAIEVPAT